MTDFILLVFTGNFVVPIIAILSIGSTITWVLASILLEGYKFDVVASILIVMVYPTPTLPLILTLTLTLTPTITPTLTLTLTLTSTLTPALTLTLTPTLTRLSGCL